MKKLNPWVGWLIGWLIGSSWVDLQHTRKIHELQVKWSSLSVDSASWMGMSYVKGSDYTYVVCTGDSIRIYEWKDYGKPRKAVKP